ncbi:MAG: hypothetical protein Q6K70_07300, partial [Thermostichales cyanobacterium DRC_bins_46]
MSWTETMMGWWPVASAKGRDSVVCPHNWGFSGGEMTSQKLSFFERYLTLWVFICIGVGIFVGKLFPNLAVTLDRLSIYQVSLPIAVCLFFMMYPIMVEIALNQV